MFTKSKMIANSHASLATYLQRPSIRLLPTEGTSRAHLLSSRSMDRRRIFELGIDSGVDTDHSAAMGEVVRPLASGDMVIRLSGMLA